MRGGSRRTVEAEPKTKNSIQDAIDRLNGRGLVYLPPGAYRTDRTIRLGSGVAVVGSGAGKTTVSLEPGSNCHLFTNKDHRRGDSDIELRAFSIEGNMHGQHRSSDGEQPTFACGGYFRSVNNLVVDGIFVREIRQTAFHFYDCSHVEIRDLEADQMGWSAVSTTSTDDIVLRGVVVTNAGLDAQHSGIHLDGGTGAFIEAFVDGCSGNAIMVDSSFSGMTDVVVRAVARRSLRGIALTGAHHHELSNVSLSGEYSDNRDVGVLVANAPNVFIVDATIASNGNAGIVLQGQVSSSHCVIADCRITGSPDLIVERDGNRVGYLTTSVAVARNVGSPDTSVVEPEPAKIPTTRLSSAVPDGELTPVAAASAADSSESSRTAAAAEASSGQSNGPDDHSYIGTCSLCGESQTFIRSNASIREGYRCRKCQASLRYRGQADAIIRQHSRRGASSIAQLVEEPAFAELDIWEPGVLGPFRKYFRTFPNYVMSDYWPDVEPGDEREGIRCEDLMALTFPSEVFDLVITSDIFEHVRDPYVGFAEVHRVLRPGGRHIFSIPVQAPMALATVPRVDTSGHEDVFILEPRYHLGPGNSQHLVYNDFGQDLLDRLAEIGLDTEAIGLDAPSSDASRLLTFCSTKVPEPAPRTTRQA